MNEIIGKKYGRLTVVSIGELKYHDRILNCVCECGNAKQVTKSNLTSGRTRSCGCLKNETLQNFDRQSHPKHGKTRTRLYRIWTHMRRRCTDPSDKAFRYYGARGIKVCREWDDFVAFQDWALANGYNNTLTIDRKDNDGDYTPHNCRWVTMKEQAINKRRRGTT